MDGNIRFREMWQHYDALFPYKNKRLCGIILFVTVHLEIIRFVIGNEGTKPLSR